MLWTIYVLLVSIPYIVHGGWGSWKPWSSCSQTCDIGTQTRHRACDNPVPQHTGNQCFGDNVDFRICFPNSCSDGGWSLWSQWSSCAQGLKTKTRPCDNPAPSRFGQACVGDYHEQALCGLTSTVSGTVPGTNNVAFMVTNPNGTLLDYVPIFGWIITNIGGGYDRNTGIFHCPVSGLYQFIITIRSRGKYQVWCYMYRNGLRVIDAGTSPDSTHDTATVSAYLQLSVGDRVYIASCSEWSHVYDGSFTTFSGARIGS